MLKLVEYGLLAVSLLVVLGLILAGPAPDPSSPQDDVSAEIRQAESH